MLLVRNAQIQAMRKVLLQSLEDRLMKHAQRYFPEVCAKLEPGLRGAIKHSIERARSYGFDGEREICKYLNLQFRFGRDFDRDLACAWAHPLLGNSLPGPPKMDRLYSLALENEPEAQGYFASTGVGSE
jgi:hypothetical protein